MKWLKTTSSCGRTAGFRLFGMLAAAFALAGCVDFDRLRSELNSKHGDGVELSAGGILVRRLPDETPAAYLERLRTVAADERNYHHRLARICGIGVIGGTAGVGADAFTREFIALGEAEELDFWQLGADADAADAAEVRKLFDGAGGKAVEIRQPGRILPPAPRCPLAVGCFAGTPPKMMLAAGSGRFSLVFDWGGLGFEYPGCGNIHRVQFHDGYAYFSNGDLWRVRPMFMKDGRDISNGFLWTFSDERAELVYRAECRTGAAVLGFEVQADGGIVIALNSTSEVVELAPDRKTELVRFKVDSRGADGKVPPPHGRLRFVHKTPDGTYLVACATAARAREYDRTGKLVREFAAPPFVFDAIRLRSGNTLVSHLTGMTEFTPAGDRVWSFACTDAPDLKLDMLCGLQEQADGSIAVGTWANGAADGSRATAAAIGRDKRVRWAYFPYGDVNMMSVATDIDDKYFNDKGKETTK